MQKTERLMAIALLLQARGKMTASHLATLLGVSTRTIYRDIMALSLAHVPVSMGHGPGGGYYLPDDYHFEPATFTREEAVSLVLSADMAGNYSLFADDDDLHRALFKLEATLPEEYRADVQTARKHILFDTTAWCNSTYPPPYLETIRSAVLGQYRLEILYPGESSNDTGGTQWRRIEPYGLVFKGISRRHSRVGVWYLVAYCQEEQAFQTFRISYIEKIRVYDEPITVRPDFNLRTYWHAVNKHPEEQTQPLALKLRVSSSARYGLRGNYTILSEEADSVVVRVEVTSAEEAISYTLGLGAGATVICPSEVRKAVAETALAIAEMYDH